jgi:hypothetical protein
LVFDQCALGVKRCNATYPCSLHNDFAACRNGMLEVFSINTLGLLAVEVEKGKTYLVR